jgi:glycosyltransferase involved in cell wall biosynthesis
LQIVGDGPATESLKALAARIYPSAEFVGEKHGSELVPYFQSADIFVLPGTGGLAVQEAMAYGLPVIVAEGDGTQTDLVHPGNGWIVPPNDPVALQEAIQVSLSDVLRLRKMGDESYRIVCEEVNLEIMVFSFIQAIQHASPRY